MRILVLNQYFRPEVASSAQRLGELVDDLAAEHDVTVVSGRPSYDPERSGGGTGSSRDVESVRVVRVPSTGFHRQRMPARILNYLTYLAGSLAAGLRGPRPDLVMAATDPPLVGLVGLLVARARRAPFVHVLWDIQPQVTVAAGLLRDGAVSRALDRLNRLVLRRAHAVVVPTRDMRRSAIALGAAPARLVVIPHWEDTGAIRPQPKDNPFSREHGLTGRFVVTYSGNLGLTQRLEQCLDLAERVRDLDDLVVLVAGEGAAKIRLQRAAAARRLRNVRFLGYQPRRRLAEALGAADVCLAPLAAGLTPYMLPSKIYTIMAAGRPLLAAVDPSSEIARLIARIDCGRVAAPGDLDALEAHVRWLHAHPAERDAMGRRGREASERHWSRAVVTPQYLDVVNRVTGGGRGDRRPPETAATDATEPAA